MAMSKNVRLLMLVFFTSTYLSQTISYAQESPAFQTVDSLRSAVQTMIRENPDEFYMPRFEESEDQLKYYLGGFAREASSSDKLMSNPVRIPADTMATIELIRMGINTNEASREFWTPVLNRAELNVASQIAVLEGTKPGEKPDEIVLRDYQKRAFREIVDAMETVAKSKNKKLFKISNPYVSYKQVVTSVIVTQTVEKTIDGRKVYENIPVTRSQVSFVPQGPKLFEVKIDAVPDEAEIFYLNKFDYVTLRSLGEGKKQFDDYLAWKNSPWSQASGTVKLRGRYYFRARWPKDGSMYQSGEYPILSDTTIPVRPQSP